MILVELELFGNKDDSKAGLGLPMKAGEWVEDSNKLELETGELFTLQFEISLYLGIMLKVSEELDMTLHYLFHLILSNFTFDGVDTKFSNGLLKRYPNDPPMLYDPRIHLNALLLLGVFFLFWCSLSIPLSFSTRTSCERLQ